MFKESINDFLNKIVSKIHTTLQFGIIIDLIDIDSIKDKKKDYISRLEQKYDYVVKEGRDKLQVTGRVMNESVNRKPARRGRRTK